MKGRVLAIVGILLSVALFAIVTFYADPIREFIGADGSIRIHGTVSGAFLTYLQRGPPVSNVVHLLTMVERRGGTLSWSESFVDTTALPSAGVPPPLSGGRTPSPSEFVGYILAPFRLLVVSFFNLLTGDASAACTGGNCFWIGGTGNFSDTSKWSTTSGGAACTCTPGATDTVTFDASSGAGTATQNNATFTSGAVTMTNSSVTVDGSTNTWNVAGSFLDANGHFEPLGLSRPLACLFGHAPQMRGSGIFGMVHTMPETRDLFLGCENVANVGVDFGNVADLQELSGASGGHRSGEVYSGARKTHRTAVGFLLSRFAINSRRVRPRLRELLLLAFGTGGAERFEVEVLVLLILGLDRDLDQVLAFE